jgi:hypothetical protein
VLWLIQADVASTGKPDARDRTPSFFVDFRTTDTLLRKFRHRRLQIVAHKIEFVAAVLFGWMNRHFGRRQREDQPSVAGVDGGKSEHIAEEGPIGLGIPAVNDDVCADEHGFAVTYPQLSDASSLFTRSFLLRLHYLAAAFCCVSSMAR